MYNIIIIYIYIDYVCVGGGPYLEKVVTSKGSRELDGDTVYITNSYRLYFIISERTQHMHREAGNDINDTSASRRYTAI